jgi:hypothetical protein
LRPDLGFGGPWAGNPWAVKINLRDSFPSKPRAVSSLALGSYLETLLAADLRIDEGVWAAAPRPN